MILNLHKQAMRNYSKREESFSSNDKVKFPFESLTPTPPKHFMLNDKAQK